MSDSRSVLRLVPRSLATFCIGLLLTLMAPIAPAVAGSVGVSPLSFEFENALRGSTLVRSLILSNDPTATDKAAITYNLTGKGEIADWLSFLPREGDTPITSVIVGPGSQEAIRVVLKVPSESANRTYTGSVFVDGTNVKEGDEPVIGAGVGTAQELGVTVKVGGVENREASVGDFVVDESEVGLVQRFTAKIRNSGNVDVAAELDVKILRNGTATAEISSKGQNFPVPPGLDDSVYVEWKTAEQLGGDYIAEFTVRDVAGIAPVVLGTKTVPFRLEPRGAFTRSGEFSNFELMDTFVQGDLVFAEASFFNTGKIPTNAVLDSQIFLEGKPVKTVQSLPRLVRPGATGRIVVSFQAVDAGSYTIKSTFNFDGDVTDERELAFEIAPNGTASSSKGSSGGSSSTGVMALGGVGALVVVGGGWLLARRRRRAS